MKTGKIAQRSKMLASLMSWDHMRPPTAPVAPGVDRDHCHDALPFKKDMRVFKICTLNITTVGTCCGIYHFKHFIIALQNSINVDDL